MKILEVLPNNINQKLITQAIYALRNGLLIAFPTDTFYAIGCDALDSKAIEKICRIKNIDPRKETLSIICADISQASEYAYIDNAAFRILKDHLPGAYTFILPASVSLPKVFKGRKEVGIRIPDNKIARYLAEELGNPILSTTAIDTEDQLPIIFPGDVISSYPNSVDILIDGEETFGTGTTVVKLIDSESPEVIRYGAGEFS